MIAISYRRDDSLGVTGRLYDRLQAKFGKANLFMDFDSIAPGANFRVQIEQTISRSDLVIAMIGPAWVGLRSDGSRRIDDPNDFVRLEIACALAQGRPIVPVLVNGASMPKPETLPPDIAELAFRNAMPLDSGIDFHHHADRLVHAISEILHSRTPRSMVPWPARRWRGKSLATGFIVLAVVVVGLTTGLLVRNHRASTAASGSKNITAVPTASGEARQGSEQKAPAAARLMAPTGNEKVRQTLAETANRTLIAPSMLSGGWSPSIAIPPGMQCFWDTRKTIGGRRQPLFILVNGTKVVYWDGNQPSLGADVRTLQFRSATREMANVTYRLVPFAK
jgi:TIR domain